MTLVLKVITNNKAQLWTFGCLKIHSPWHKELQFVHIFPLLDRVASRLWLRLVESMFVFSSEIDQLHHLKVLNIKSFTVMYTLLIGYNKLSKCYLFINITYIYLSFLKSNGFLCYRCTCIIIPVRISFRQLYRLPN